MTSMIDVVFLLLVFFLLSARFIALEEMLPADQPRGRGLAPVFDTVPMAEVIVDLAFRGETASAVAFTSGAGGGSADGVKAFATREDRRLGYRTPDFDGVERWLRERATEYGKLTPVTVRFDDAVPWQMVVGVIDACARVGLADVAVGASPVEP